MSSDNFYIKYIKYKNKYLNYKKLLGGAYVANDNFSNLYNIFQMVECDILNETDTHKRIEDLGPFNKVKIFPAFYNGGINLNQKSILHKMYNFNCSNEIEKINSFKGLYLYTLIELYLQYTMSLLYGPVLPVPIFLDNTYNKDYGGITKLLEIKVKKNFYKIKKILLPLVNKLCSNEILYNLGIIYLGLKLILEKLYDNNELKDNKF
jgi:hypothetical protein